jgi:hypothetical protein
MGNTLTCSHISKVVEWGFDSEHNFKATMYGCVLCDATQEKPFEYEDIDVDHTACDEDCFGCKAKGLILATGDASGHIIEAGITQKKWDSELAFYKDARAQGIQPEGTNRKVVEKAIEASEALNRPYNGETMVQAKDINKNTVEVMKEVGML